MTAGKASPRKCYSSPSDAAWLPQKEAFTILSIVEFSLGFRHFRSKPADFSILVFLHNKCPRQKITVPSTPNAVKSSLRVF